MLSHDDILQIKTELDERYVLQSDCSDTQAKFNGKFANDDKRIEIVIQKFGIVEKLMWAVATSSIGALIVAIFELIKGA